MPCLSCFRPCHESWNLEIYSIVALAFPQKSHIEKNTLDNFHLEEITVVETVTKSLTFNKASEASNVFNQFIGYFGCFFYFYCWLLFPKFAQLAIFLRSC